MAQVMFYAVTAAQFAAAEKNENALYFITDANRIYKGATPFTHPVQLVEAFPEKGEPGTVYVDSATHEAKVWTGSAWAVASPAVIAQVEGATGEQLATAVAVKSYVDGKIVEVNSGVSGAVANVTYADKAITVAKGTGSPVVTALSGLFDGVSYDGETGELSFTTNGGAPMSVNLPLEQFISAASYDHPSKTLTLTLNNGTAVEVSLSDLVDLYSGGTTGTAQVTVSGNAITADVKVSADAGNIISAKENGVYASVEWQTL